MEGHMTRFAYIVLTIALCLGAAPTVYSASAESSDPPEGDSCKSVVSRYGKRERLIWDHVRKGMKFEFPNEYPEYNVLDPEFLRTILTHKRCRELIKYRGVKIIGAAFWGKLNLSDVSLTHPLRLEHAVFHVAPNFNSFRSTHDLSLLGSTVLCKKEPEVDIAKARIEGDLNLERTKFDCTLDMGHLHVGGSLYMQKGSRVDAGHTIVRLSNAKITGKVSLEGATADELDLVKLHVGSDLAMHDQASFKTVKAGRANIGGTLNIVGTRIQNLDLSGAKVDGPFKMDDGRWPRKLNLLGLTFDSVVICPEIGCPVVEKAETSAGRTMLLEKFKKWLEVAEYSRQPYDHLGKVLEKKGYVEAATEIYYEARVRERKSASGLNWAWQVWQEWLIGYGYRKWYVLCWIVVLVGIGARIYRFAPETRKSSWPDAVVFSLDKLLPIVELRKKHGDIDFSGWHQYYFYLLQIMGWILASFLLAALSGLSK
jgi:hypothetical protein